MSDRVRGRALIINIKEYSHTDKKRTASDVDYDNISLMFKVHGFVIAKSQKELSNLTKREIIDEILEETSRKEHKKLGMFVLVMMSFGKRGGLLLDCNEQAVDLSDIQALLSPGNFGAMEGKPKLLIIQACSGVREDHGANKSLLVEVISSASDASSQSAASTANASNQSTGASGSSNQSTAGASDSANQSTGASGSSNQSTGTSDSANQSATGASDSVNQSASGTSGSSSQSTGACGSSNQSVTASTSPLTFIVPFKGPYPAPKALNVDDFYIMKASSESYLATRHPTHGSWFIRTLVHTFYEHSNHKDIETLFKIIQARVRHISLAPENVKRDDYQGGNTPTAICTFTKFRKLYLFPGYNPR